MADPRDVQPAALPGMCHVEDPELDRQIQALKENILYLRKKYGDLIVSVTKATPFPWSKLRFGYTISGTTVTLKAGEVQWGRHDPVELGDTNFVITADLQYIGIEFTYSSTAPTITALGPSVTKTNFKSDDLAFRTWIFQWRLVSGVVSLYRIGNMGDIKIPAAFGE